MTTLKDVWVAQGMSSTDVASKVGCSVPLLYRLHRKGGSENGVAYGTVREVCKVLGLSLDAFEALEPCPDAGMYPRSRGEHKKG